MYKRPHHQLIEKVISSLNINLLTKTNTFFGGGTAIALLLDEYRESIDIDFLCSSSEGFSTLRNSVTNNLGDILTNPIEHIRDINVSRDAIRAILRIDGKPIKIEFIKEGNSTVSGEFNTLLKVPTLSKIDMFTQKILANADRGMDKSINSRDIIDLAMMIHYWGGIPKEALDKSYKAYSDYAKRGLKNSVNLIQDSSYLQKCIENLKMESGNLNLIKSIFKSFQNQYNNASNDSWNILMSDNYNKQKKSISSKLDF